VGGHKKLAKEGRDINVGLPQAKTNRGEGKRQVKTWWHPVRLSPVQKAGYLNPIFQFRS